MRIIKWKTIKAVLNKQEQMKQSYDLKTQNRMPEVGDRVYYRNFSRTSSDKFVPGIVHEQDSAGSVLIESQDSAEPLIERRHVDHVFPSGMSSNESISTDHNLQL